MTTPSVMSSKRWASNDARFGPRQVTLIDTRRDKALIRYADGRTAWILAHRVHETREQAFCALLAGALRLRFAEVVSWCRYLVSIVGICKTGT